MRHRCLGFLCLIICFAALSPVVEGKPQCSGSSAEKRLEMNAAQVRACIEGLFPIENAILEGKDIVDVVVSSARAMNVSSPSPDGSVRIKNSIVRNGLYFLDFPGLPETPVRDLPEELQSRILELGVYKKSDKVRVANMSIRISDSRIVGNPSRHDTSGPVLAFAAGNVIFAGEVNFIRSTFEGSVQLSHAAFLDKVVFNTTTFNARVTFDAASFGKAASFNGAVFAGTTDGATLFPYSRFAEEAGFQKARFESGPVFEKARFCGPVNLGAATLPAGTSFTGIRVASDANLLEAKLPNGADFSEAQFAGRLLLASKTAREISGNLNFARAQVVSLKVGSPNSKSVIDADLDFADARIGRASFKDVRFNAPVRFVRARMGPDYLDMDLYKNYPYSAGGDGRMLGSPARIACMKAPTGGPDDANTADVPKEAQAADIELEDVSFAQKLDFKDSLFQASVTFKDLKFDNGADLGGVTFKTPTSGMPFLHFTHVQLDDFEMDLASVPDLAAFELKPGNIPASQLFGKLEDLYLKRDQRKEGLNARRAKEWALIKENWKCFRAAQPCAENTSPLRMLAAGWGITSGFGTLLLRLVLIIAAIDLLFAAIYFRFGRFLKRDSGGQEKSKVLHLHPLLLPSALAPTGSLKDTQEESRDFRTALALSTLALLRVGDSDRCVKGAVGSFNLRSFVRIEWFVGGFLLLDLVYTLTETQPFLHRIINAVLG